MAGTFRDPSAHDKNHKEAVIVDNQFHRRLSGVRNRDVMDNHPDIELMHQERNRQVQKEISTLYNMAPLAQPQSDEQMPVVSRRHNPQEETLYSFEQVVFQLAKETRRANKFLRPMTVMVLAFNDLLSLAAVHGVDVYERAIVYSYSSVASCLEPEIDIIGIFGTDRLLVVLPETHGAQATYTAENIRILFQNSPFEFGRHSFHIKPSIGIACLPIHGRDFKELIARADLAADAIAQAGGDAFGFGHQQ